MAKETRIEVKVGALIVLCVVLLVGFLLLLSDISFGESASIKVDWRSSGGLKVGAPVKIAGMVSGRVEDVEYLGGKFDEAVGRQVYVRVELSIKPELRETLRDDASFYITTVGLLGEKYVEIDPGVAEGALANDAIPRGVDPMRLEVMAENVNSMLARTAKILEDNEEALGKTIENISLAAEAGKLTIEDGQKFVQEARATLKETRENLQKLVTKGDAVMTSVDTAVTEFTPGKGETGNNIKAITQSGKDVAAAIDSAVGDGSEIRGAIKDTRALTTKAKTVIDTVGKRAISFAGKAEGLIDTAGAVMNEGKGDVLLAIADVRKIMAVIQDLLKNMRDGKGTVGALLNDREMFDDARELMKDLKRHPWKFLWKE